MHCCWWNNCSLLETNFIKTGCFLSSGWFPGLGLSFEHIFVRENLSPCANRCWSNNLLTWVGRHFPFGAIIGFQDPFLDLVLSYSKVIRLHAIVHDAAGALLSHPGKMPGCCYTCGRGPTPCLLGYVTLLSLNKTRSAYFFQFCQLLMHYVLLCTGFWACRYNFCWGVVNTWWECSGLLILSYANFQTATREFWCKRDWHGTGRAVEVKITVSCWEILSKSCGSWMLCKKDKKARFSVN